MSGKDKEYDWCVQRCKWHAGGQWRRRWMRHVWADREGSMHAPPKTHHQSRWILPFMSKFDTTSPSPHPNDRSDDRILRAPTRSPATTRLDGINLYIFLNLSSIRTGASGDEASVDCLVALLIRLGRKERDWSMRHLDSWSGSNAGFFT